MAALLAERYPALAVRASTVASELIENAVKYGEGTVELRCPTEDDRMVIVASKNASNHPDLESIKRHIDLLRASEDPFVLYHNYANRLMEPMANPDTKAAQLGLFRIACEGQCELEHTIKDNRLEVRSSRSVRPVES